MMDVIGKSWWLMLTGWFVTMGAIRFFPEPDRWVPRFIGAMVGYFLLRQSLQVAYRQGKQDCDAP